jgi:regulator of replication initiation timing
VGPLDTSWMHKGRTTLLVLVIGIWTLAPVVAIYQRTSDLRAQVRENAATNQRLTADEAQLTKVVGQLQVDQAQARNIGNQATIDACTGRNNLRDEVIALAVQLAGRTRTAQLAVLRAPASTQVQRVAALKLIQSSREGVQALGRALPHERCSAPF